MTPCDEVFVGQTYGGRMGLPAGVGPCNDTLMKDTSKVSDRV
ncbi:hypothetical protein [Arthrobacter sp. UYEF36]